MKISVLALFLAGAAAAYAQQNPPQQPPVNPPANPPQNPPAQAQPQPAPQDPVKDEILYEKWRLERNGMVTIYYRVGHDRGKLLKALLEGGTIPGQVQGDPRARILSKDGWVMESEAMHLMVVSDTKENIGLVEQVLRVLDVPDPQIIIEAKVVELRWDKDMEFGFEGDVGPNSQLWIGSTDSGAFLRELRSKFNPTEAITGGPFQGSTFRFSRTTGHSGSIGGVVQAFLERGKGEILSAPRIMVDSGDDAIVKAGEEFPYPEVVLHPGGSTTSVKYQPTGVTLSVKPHIVGASNVHLVLNLDVKALLGFVNLPTGTAPSFTSRSAQTKVTVRNGEEIVIGGLRRKEKHTLRRGLPFLSDIPIIGSLFGRYEEQEVTQEILFFIKPIIIQSGRDMPRSIIDPGRK